MSANSGISSNFGVHEVNLQNDNPSKRERQEIIRYAMQINPTPSSGKDGLSSASGGDSLSASSASPLRLFENNIPINIASPQENGNDEPKIAPTVLERNEIIVILHKIRQSVHNIIYFGDLSQN